MTEEYVKKDPNGLIRQDILHLNTVFRQPAFTPKHKIEDIMYIAGQQSVLDYIQREMVGKRDELHNQL